MLITKRRDHGSLRCKVREERTSAGRPLCWTLNARKRTAPNLVTWSRNADTVSHGIPTLTTMMTCEDWGPYPLMARKIENVTQLKKSRYNFCKPLDKAEHLINGAYFFQRKCLVRSAIHVDNPCEKAQGRLFIERPSHEDLYGQSLWRMDEKLTSLKAIVMGRCSYSHDW